MGSCVFIEIFSKNNDFNHKSDVASMSHLKTFSRIILNMGFLYT